MTSRAKVAAAAPAPHWHSIPEWDDEPPPRTFPACQDGDELLARVNGEVVEVTVERRHGCRFVGPDGETVMPDAIAERPRTPSRSGTRYSEAELRERYDTLKVRLPLGYKARLQRLAEDDGYSVAEWIATWIEMAEEELAEIRSRPPKRPG